MNTVNITIGDPARNSVVIPLVLTATENPVQAAKKLRKEVADNISGYGYAKGTVVKPSELYWAVFHSITDEKPFAASDNYFCQESLQREFEAKRAAELLDRQARRAIRMIELEIHLGKCPNCGCYSLVDGICTACDAAICDECFGVLDEDLYCENCKL